jgi:hypothetical protein
MPWSIIQKDGRYCIVKEGGEVKKCYDKRKDALQYLKALYVNTKDEEWAKKERD